VLPAQPGFLESDLGASLPSPLFGVFMVAMLAAVVLCIVAWRWAVRRPVVPPMNSQPDAPVRPFVYAAVGASDVVGVGARNPDKESWVNVVSSYMPPGTRFVSLGRSGITLREANAIEVPKAIAVQPDLVTMWNCVNDAVHIMPLDGYTAELRRALSALTTKTPANVLVLNLPDLSLLLQYSSYAPQQDLVRAGVIRWNEAIEKTAAEFGSRVKVMDLFPISYEAQNHPEYISRDNFHPSTEGYRRLGELVWSDIVANGWAPEEAAGEALSEAS